MHQVFRGWMVEAVPELRDGQSKEEGRFEDCWAERSKRDSSLRNDRSSGFGQKKPAADGGGYKGRGEMRRERRIEKA